MNINTNVASMFASRLLQAQQQPLQTHMARLASGLRINSAKDDAAGLSIADRMTSQVRSLNQGVRNANDGVGLLQTADGAMEKITDNLQRVRELAVQAANDTNSSSDRQSLQKEAAQLFQEINRIAYTTEFNGKKLLDAEGRVTGDPSQQAIIDGLRGSWLTESEKLIQNYYGITADGAGLKIVIDAPGTPSGTLAYVSGLVNGTTGKIDNQELHIDLADFPANPPNGGTSPMYSDRIIAHEMVHAVMGRSMNMGALPTWFLEGAAELIHGADERLSGDISLAGGNVATIVAEVGNGWAGTSADYSSAYAAARYMHSRLKSFGGNGIKDLMMSLSGGSTLDSALNSLSGGTWTNTAAFVADYSANGVAFIGSMNLTNTDTGAIGGFDADSGAVQTAETVMPDNGGYSLNPLSGFVESWPAGFDGVGGNTTFFDIQVGEKSGESIKVGLDGVSATALGLDNLDLATDAGSVIGKIDYAMEFIGSQRATVGAAMNRLEHAISVSLNTHQNVTAARSRIQDADYAAEVAGMTRRQILTQAGTAMLVQANTSKDAVLQLLR